MNGKIVLVSLSLSFVSLGRGTMHIKIGAYRRAACGRIIPAGTEPQVSRQRFIDQVCQKCVANQMRIGKVKIESEATAP